LPENWSKEQQKQKTKNPKTIHFIQMRPCEGFGGADHFRNKYFLTKTFDFFE
jgi:hypothetical protein